MSLNLTLTLTLTLTATLTSKLPTRCKYGVITRQLHRYNIACTQLRDFMQPATDLYATYPNNGYNRHKVDMYFETCICHQTPTVSPLTAWQ